MNKTVKQQENDAAALRGGTFEYPNKSRKAQQRANRKDRRSARQHLRSSSNCE